MMLKNLHALLVAAAVLIMSSSLASAQLGGTQIGSQAGASPFGAGGPAASSRASSIPALSTGGLGAVPEDFAKLKLAPGFKVGLNVLDDPDFAGSFRIDEEGDIAVPTLGTIHIAGETAAEARAQIQKRLLEGKILRDPQVDLSVLEYTETEITVVGEVNNPGKHPLLSSHKLVDVLALAGGTSITAGDEVKITRGDEGGEPLVVHYSRSTDPKTIENVIVNPGDTVLVKRAGIVYVLGAVNRPGGFVMQEDGTLNVLEAISLANGTAILASTKRVYLLRRNQDGTVVYVELPYKAMTRGKSANVELHAEDILYVPTDAIKLFYSDIQSLATAAASATIYATAYH
ncbi:MAG: polysaccharide biosynthesis/export family protein [Terracidiphilus sp.]|jgi:polysaccharide export outer membrane protein